MTSSRPPIQSESALGLVSTRSFPAIIGVADNMLKAASVRLVGYEKTGSGYCTAVVRGGISDVRLAIDAGVDFAERIGQLVSSSVIPRPLANLEAVLPISDRLAQIAAEQGYSRLSNQAVGLLETRGFPAMVGAADAMLKSAEVYLSGYEIVGDGLCTAVIRGRISDVTVAVEAGMHEADRIGELHSVMVIPRPLEDLEETLPTASCWIEQPIALPISIKETQKELVSQAEAQAQSQAKSQAMPDLRQLPVADLEPVQFPEAAQPELLQFEVQPEVVRTEVVRTEVAQPEVAQPEVAESEAIQTEVIQPEVLDSRSEPIIRAKPFVLPEESID
ncbi:MAG: BMC domain-containing protein [Pegethrix bostrychoides GSE-TBD4-15B]|jgi:carbon dioxide concentrating mechanism protein CcmO|uniref:BMC domain-containing protein n=1 Tax=Pegethrix bostrychoides GSE-TBD4-15B TaxID=2839662 RepID=A0A951U4A9_9CYAN|nr:BMC domain-containing protein [Pegethrix bostrychoides GSE-TBD4-15B]